MVVVGVIVAAGQSESNLMKLSGERLLLDLVFIDCGQPERCNQHLGYLKIKEMTDEVDAAQERLQEEEGQIQKGQVG